MYTASPDRYRERLDEVACIYSKSNAASNQSNGMASPPSTPRYARPTWVSMARANLTSPVSKSPASKQKRRSSPVPMSVKPADTKKPCPFAALPAELRLRIYSHILPKGPVYTAQWRFMVNRSSWSSLLRVCRLIRVEASYEFYTQTAFMFVPVDLDNYESLRTWLMMVPLAQRSLPVKNPNVRIRFKLQLYKETYGKEIWEVCKRFGNSYYIPYAHREHFANFCRLATWWLWCAEHVSTNLTWNYEIDISSMHRWYTRSDVDLLREWFDKVLQTVSLPCVQKAWVRERREAEMKMEAIKMLEAVDRAVQLRRGTRPPDGEWARKVRALRRFLEKW
ncbi:hypothetical protein K458DRAFT_428913 [Lentithecium fluviatile CBS 122367]|uniref:F-box domain-containing protein n=1 Tax=Lentithecium fluviatile CBS 122367 TaxID=1168545 RepID=A0A6G1JDC1_9PLEO|nr:hypothetical protein K458DRAFT_428913 [Lentithecium fluviatile CBS 122367]